uniref:Uncharacterized protein n=1 Tax=Amphimedon queenslandica TaxID=400682 RepID=A0A1X7TBT3_AMPQE
DELMLVGMVDTGGLVGTGGMRAGECCSVYLGFKPRHITTRFDLQAFPCVNLQVLISFLCYWCLLCVSVLAVFA